MPKRRPRKSKIDAIEDNAEREKALIDYERQATLRDLTERGLLTAEMRAKLGELAEIQLAGVKEDATGDAMMRQEAMFDTRLAAQRFGGGVSEDTKLLRNVDRNIASIKNKRGGILFN
jgi:hypothetical protein